MKTLKLRSVILISIILMIFLLKTIYKDFCRKNDHDVNTFYGKRCNDQENVGSIVVRYHKFVTSDTFPNGPGIIEILQSNYEKKSFNSQSLSERELPQPVVILTYMRSGSSFIGDILQANDESFYLFEPHRSIQFGIRRQIVFHYLDGSNRTYTNFLNAAVDSLISWFTCDFKSLPLVFFEDGFLSYSRKAKAFRTCKDYKIKTDHFSKAEALEFCANVLDSLCLKSKYIIVKAIRIPLQLLEPIMDRFPHMRIIHLLRDPRAVIRSQMTYNVVQKFHLSSNSTRYCNRVYRDVIAAERMANSYVGRFYALHYEDLAGNPIKSAENMYKFLGMDFTSHIQSFVLNITSAGKSCNTPLCTVVSNSTEQVDKWRNKVTIDFVKIVDQSCAPLYSVMGLRSIPTDIALKDRSFKIRSRTDEFEMGDYRFA